MMSERSTRSRNSSRPLASRRFSVTAFLLRACTVQKKWWPSSSAWPQVRSGIGRARRFDLDDLGAHVAQQPSGERAGDQRADLDDADAVQRSGDAHCEKPCRVAQSATMPTASRSLSALVGTSVVVVRYAGSFVHLLIRMPDGFGRPAGVARCARVVGEVADHDRRARRCRGRTRQAIAGSRRCSSISTTAGLTAESTLRSAFVRTRRPEVNPSDRPGSSAGSCRTCAHRSC